MSEDSRIRFAVKDDTASLIELIREFAVFEKLDHVLAVSEESIVGSFFSDDSFCKSLVIENDRKLIGYSIFYPCFKSFSGLKSLFLEDLYIKPEFRGHGLGKELFRSVSDHALQNGFSRIDFQVLDWNKEAVEFYEHLGAKRIDGNLDYSIDLDTLKNIVK